MSPERGKGSRKKPRGYIGRHRKMSGGKGGGSGGKDPQGGSGTHKGGKSPISNTSYKGSHAKPGGKDPKGGGGEDKGPLGY